MSAPRLDPFDLVRTRVEAANGRPCSVCGGRHADERDARAIGEFVASLPKLSDGERTDAWINVLERSTEVGCSCTCCAQVYAPFVAAFHAESAWIDAELARLDRELAAGEGAS